jgi:hypothetical protein
LLKNIAGNAMLFWLPIIVSSLLENSNSTGHYSLITGERASSPNSLSVEPNPVHLRAKSGNLVHNVSHVLLSLNNTTTNAVSPIGLVVSPVYYEGREASPNEENVDVHGVYLPVLLSSLPFLATAVTALLLGRSSQACNERAFHLAIPYLTAGLLFLALPSLHLMSLGLVFWGLTLAIAFTHVSLVSLTYVIIVLPKSCDE